MYPNFVDSPPPPHVMAWAHNWPLPPYISKYALHSTWVKPLSPLSLGCPLLHHSMQRGINLQGFIHTILMLYNTENSILQLSFETQSSYINIVFFCLFVSGFAELLSYWHSFTNVFSNRRVMFHMCSCLTSAYITYLTHNIPNSDNIFCNLKNRIYWVRSH